MKINPQLKEELKKHLDSEIQKSKEEVILFSPYSLEQLEIDSLLNCFPMLKRNSVKNIVDSSLIGGVIIQYGSKIIDLSIKSVLHTFQKKLYEIN
ncbi:hypothetical protein COY87_01820 [Candidatus Roizmanbacteria bacterium CG_4_10_14_0_8_um_filter_33_9]|uniref:Uncharacterized protein n=1 Tax=Candidatus Roizmanbacteria bacterium CG_4_10_14_0_8_um_filter_33_9 TaxID=1974826 RepID=A0A2M7QJ09_9BACT|nr:MAG: hypothetical protein COY87_01820 [Candidatus Roizmanbacteria bacterium CG_4_10_14_0_8_um_filter_33_9]